VSLDNAVYLLLVTSIVLANIPWILANRLFVFIPIVVEAKTFLVNIFEWFSYFILMGVISYFLEQKVMGHVKDQEWEFYAINLFMFAIFSFPGVIYRYNFKSFIKTSN